MKQIWITDEAYNYVRQTAFELKKSMGSIVSNSILNNVEVKQCKKKQYI